MPNEKPIGVACSDPNITDLYLNGTLVTADAAELNKLDGVTSTTAELNTVAGAIASVSQTEVSASGSTAVQFTFKNAAGVAIGSKRSMLMWLSDDAGEPVTAITSLAALTNGSYDNLVTGKQARVTCSVAGLLGITVTQAGASTKYLSFQLPNGKILTSTVLTINA